MIGHLLGSSLLGGRGGDWSLTWLFLVRLEGR